MASLLKHMPSSALAARPHHAYLARGTRPEARARVAATATGVYVGNLAFVTSDAALHALFSRCGAVDRVIMGLNAQTRLPCGFAFVLFFTRKAALDAVRFLHGTVLDERLIKVELDKGFYEGRQYGRGPSGGQVRDDMRTTYDEGRGGFGTGAISLPLLGGGGGGGGGSDRRRSGASDGRRGGGGGGGARGRGGPRASYGSGGRPSYGGGGRPSYGGSGGARAGDSPAAAGDDGAAAASGYKRRRHDDDDAGAGERAGGDVGGRAADADGGGGGGGDDGLDEFGRVRRDRDASKRARMAEG